MTKKIKKSNRGLTFSFNGEKTKFNIGAKYKYIIDVKSGKVFIIAAGEDEKNTLKVSKKKVGIKIKSLFDLRSKKIQDTFKDTDYLEVDIKSKIIIVNGYKESIKNTFKKTVYKALRKDNKVIDIKGVLKSCVKIGSCSLELSLLKKASGGVNDVEQISFLDSIFNQEESYSTSEKEYIENDMDNVFKVFSVFSGAGMMDYPLALDKSFEIVKAIEYDKAACDSYKANIGNIIINDDIKNIKVSDIPKNTHVLWGGPVCKSFSNANRIKRLENHDDSKLLLEYIRLANDYDFKCFVMENVPQILTSANGKYFNLIKEKLRQYNIYSLVLKDNECGGCTTRQRAFIIGSKIGIPMLNVAKKIGGTVRKALSKVNDTWHNFKDWTIPKTKTLEKIKCVPQGGNWEDIPRELHEKSWKVGKTHSNTYRRLELDRPSITIPNPRKSVLIHPTENRGLSISEALSISSFDKNFKLTGSLNCKQQQIGNGVPFKMAETVKNIIKDLLIRHYYGANVVSLNI